MYLHHVLAAGHRVSPTRAPLVIGVFVTLLLALPRWVQADHSELPHRLTVGVAPYLSVRALLRVYHPLEEHLEHQLGRPVEIFSGLNFRAFYENAVRGDFDVAIMPAHLARLAEKELGFVPLVRYTSGARGLVVVADGSRLRSAEDLRGRTVAVPDRLALATILCLEWLHLHGIEPGHSFRLLQTPSFGSAMLALQRGEADAAVSAPGALAQMPGEWQKNTRVIVDTGEYINLVYMAHPRLDDQARSRITSALLAFARDSSGQRFFQETGFGTFAAVKSADLRALDPYLGETKRLLTRPPGR
jgi:phosphonate transport system substrate-binding protein